MSRFTAVRATSLLACGEGRGWGSPFSFEPQEKLIRKTQTMSPKTMLPECIDLPFEDILSECTALLERMDALLGTVEPLTTQEIRNLGGRKGNAIAKEIVAQCADLGISQAGSVSLDDVTSSLERAEELRRVLDLVDLVRARLDASRVQASARSSRAALTFYALLRGLRTSDPTLEGHLEPVRNLLRTKRTKGAARPLRVARKPA